ncbi:MAG: hypothetical protein HY208_02660 [Nitrospirae bacterium]|nr:hypothetical protein [Nitrospirota bacterium]
MMRRMTSLLTIAVGASIFIWTMVTAAPVRAEVNVNINVGVPPPIVVEAPPEMVLLPEPGIYVAIGIPFDIFFISGRYYYFHGGNWFWASGYGGPWVHVGYKSLPPGLRKYKVEKLREFREREFKVYKAQGPKFRGKKFVAVQGPGPKARHEVKEQMKERRGEGRGR